MYTCQDRFGKFPSAVFNVYTCAMCYQYLFDSDKQHHPLLKKPSLFGETGPLVQDTKTDNSSWSGLNRLELLNSSIAEMSCSSMKEADCRRWTECCAAARRCCMDQMALTVLDTENPFCPMTWDGFTCINYTTAGSIAYVQCPSYFTEFTSSAALARKYCTENGSWYKDEAKGQEWTDYTACIQLQNYRLLFYTAVGCHATSLVLTLPGTLIFLAFRQLRQQHRVQIHLNLFMSSILTNVVWILWENLIYSDRLENAEDTFMHRNTAGCKILYSLTRYAVSANFFWMFLEGVYLLRLVVNAFVLPRSLAGYYVFGWAGPLPFLLIYIGFRIYHAHGGCWVHMVEGYEWWIYTPNLFMIVANLISLAWIVYTLTTQIHVHPNEPSCYRRALKAIVLLTPLFGLQMIFVIYRPRSVDNSMVLEITAVIFKSSQGAVVALLFCYFNGGVRTQIKSYLKNIKERLTFQNTTSTSNRERRS